MTPQERQEQVNHMHRAIDIAVDVWTLISDKELTEIADGIQAADIHLDEILSAIATNWKAPLSDKRKQALGHALVEAIGLHSISSCGLWHFAHLLDHVLFEEDLSHFYSAD